MSTSPRRYRKKPLAAFEHGTRIYSPTGAEDCYRVTATDATGRRLFHKFASEHGARAKARELEAYLADHTPLSGRRSGERTVATLAGLYLAHLTGRSTRYQERQESLLRCWVLPRLGPTPLGDWTPAMSEDVLGAARTSLAPQSVQGLGACMRALVTFAHKSRWLPQAIDPMWMVSYTPKAEFQGQAPGFVPEENLPNDDQCRAIFDALASSGEPVWGLAMALKHRSGARWGELIALRPADIEFDPHRVVRIHQAVEQSRSGLTMKATKNTQKRSSIFPASLAVDLHRHVETVRAGSGDAGLLFPGPNGQPPERRQFHRLWVRAAEKAGWPMRSATVAEWHPHHLRHVAACWMLFDLHLDPAVVSRMLGHANPAFTMSRYVGVRVGADAATNAITEGW